MWVKHHTIEECKRDRRLIDPWVRKSIHISDEQTNLSPNTKSNQPFVNPIGIREYKCSSSKTRYTIISGTTSAFWLLENIPTSKRQYLHKLSKRGTASWCRIVIMYCMHYWFEDMMMVYRHLASQYWMHGHRTAGVKNRKRNLQYWFHNPTNFHLSFVSHPIWYG